MRIKFEIYHAPEPLYEKIVPWPASLPVPVAGDMVIFDEQENLIVHVNHRKIVLVANADCDVILAVTTR